MPSSYGYGPVANTTGQSTSGLLATPAIWSNGNPTPSYAGAVQPYQYGLQNTFDLSPSYSAVNQPVGPFNGMPTANNNYQYASSTDPDVIAAQGIANEEAQARAGMNPGVDFSADNALLQMYEGRIGQKNTLGSEINANGTQRMGAIQEDQATANSALGQGINNTDSNYNSRGLLFSGAREAGEQQVRGNVASSLASSVAGTQQDYAQTLAAQQNAYANVDLAGASQAWTMAQQAASTASANNIARLQAMQQLGSGVASAAGTIAGSAATSGNPASYINPAAGWDPAGTSGINTPYNGGGQFGGYLSDPSYSAGLGDSYFGSGSNPSANPYGSQ